MPPVVGPLRNEMLVARARVYVNVAHSSDSLLSLSFGHNYYLYTQNVIIEVELFTFRVIYVFLNYVLKSPSFSNM